MKDYSEIIKTLRLANSWQFAPGYAAAMLAAADAIEELQKERDAAVADISWIIVNKMEVCKICKNRFSEDPTNCLECDDLSPYGNFEWRGVEDGNT